MTVARTGHVRSTIATSIGCPRNHAGLDGTTASMTTTSARNANQISQFRTSAIISHGSGGGSSCKIVTGIVSTAATMSGRSKRLAIRSLCSSIPG
jgi:hypothetical protein